MRIDKNDVKANKISFIPENLTDLYAISNLIEKADIVFANTTRRVRKGDKAGREGDKGERIRMFIGISVLNVEFQDAYINQRLRIKGTIVSGPDEHISLNSNHTLNVKVTTKITIQKMKWNDIHFKIINDSENSSKRPSIGVVALEKGYVSIGIINNYTIHHLIQDRQVVSSKFLPSKNRTNSEIAFYKKVLGFIKNYFASDDIKNILIGGPGKYKIKFLEYLNSNWLNHNRNIIIEDLSSGSENGIRELLNRSTFEKLASDYQIVEESKIISEFELLLIKDIGKVCYGIEDCLKAAEQGAIESFLVINTYLTQPNSDQTKNIEFILDLLVKTKSKLLIVDENSDNGKIVKKFGGMLGILRYSLFSD